MDFQKKRIQLLLLITCIIALSIPGTTVLFWSTAGFVGKTACVLWRLATVGNCRLITVVSALSDTLIVRKHPAYFRIEEQLWLLHAALVIQGGAGAVFKRD